MEVWIMLGLPIAGIIFLIDYWLRRKKWKDNTKEEKISLVVNMASVVPNLIFSAFGILMGIVGSGTKTPVGKVIAEVTLVLAGFYFVVAIAATIGSLILRKKGKNKASVWINVAAFAYIVLMAFAYYLVGVLL